MTTARFWNLSASPEGDTLTIYINGVIDPLFGTDGDTSSAEIAEQLRMHKAATAIDVRINSLGGSLAGGVGIYNQLRAHGAEVSAYVDGIAASAASVIAMAGRRIVMGKGAMMMVHLPQAATFGDAQDHRASADMLDVAGEALASIYVEKTGKSLDEIRALLEAETWLTAEAAVEQGFATAIAGESLRVEAHAGGVLVAGTLFARAGVPAPILALMTDRAPEQLPGVRATAPQEILNAEAHGRAQAIAEERARYKAISELCIWGHNELVWDAIVNGLTPEQLVMAVHNAERVEKSRHAKAMAGLLEARREESQIVASVRQSRPERGLGNAEQTAARTIAGHINATRNK